MLRCKKDKPQLFFFNMAYSLLPTLGLAILLIKLLPLYLLTKAMMSGLVTTEEINTLGTISLSTLKRIKKTFLITAFKIWENMMCPYLFKKWLKKVEDPKLVMLGILRELHKCFMHYHNMNRSFIMTRSIYLLLWPLSRDWEECMKDHLTLFHQIIKQ